MNAAIIRLIRRANGISLATRAKFFKGMDVMSIRKWLEEHGLNRHMSIEACSTEVVLLAPEGVVMQLRSDDNSLGLWGGEINPEEDPLYGAQREVFEETNLWVDLGDFEFAEKYEHSHTYPNGDRCHYHTYRYIIRFPAVPRIETDRESKGFFVVKYLVEPDQLNFVKRILRE